MDVSIDLTDAGVAHVEEVVAAVFAYLHVMRCVFFKGGGGGRGCWGFCSTRLYLHARHPVRVLGRGFKGFVGLHLPTRTSSGECFFGRGVWGFCSNTVSRRDRSLVC